MASVEDRRKSRLGDVFEQELFNFMKTSSKDQLMEIMKDPREQIHYPVIVSFVELNYECGSTTTELLRYPDKVLESGDRAAYRAQLFIHQSYENKDELKIKQHIHLRISQIPEVGIDRYMTSFPGTEEVGTFMAIVGTVGKICRSGPREYKRDYCCNKCKEVTTMLAPRSRYYVLPESIDQCEKLCQKAKVVACKIGVEGLTVKDAHRFKDYQEIKVHEQFSQHGYGSLPNALWVVLEDDLVDSCQPGDDVIITGTLYTRFRPFRVNQPIDVSLALMANHVEVKNHYKTSLLQKNQMRTFFKDFWKQHEDNPFEGRNLILRSFCPQICGMYLIKMAMSVVLAGGVSKDDNGSRVRGQSHLLLVGDPGTAKSQMLKYACKLIPRSIFTTGTGTTAAGLTAAAVMENGSWTLEAGALVLADSGLCCIDEFSSMKEIDRVSIHEAMEQQTISIAKAGMVTKLNTRCTIIAATNPPFLKNGKPQQWEEDDIDMTIGLPSPLISRFDLVIILKDDNSEEWDEMLCDFLLGDHKVLEKEETNDGIIPARGVNATWDTDTLKFYMVLIKEEKNPEITKDAEQILSQYYHVQRKSANRNVSRTSVRLYESLFRLAKGHARLMFRDTVEIHDAVTAICLMEMSMQSSTLIPDPPNPLLVKFPLNAFEEYSNHAMRILKVLNLPDLWEKEKIYLDNLSTNRRNPSQPPPPQPPLNSTNTSEDPSIIHETPPNPEDFFQTDEPDDGVTPCSLRIVK